MTKSHPKFWAVSKKEKEGKGKKKVKGFGTTVFHVQKTQLGCAKEMFCFPKIPQIAKSWPAIRFVLAHQTKQN